MTAQDLSTHLWHERELLELLVFKLEEEQLLLNAGKSRWVAHATREVEQVLERLRESGLAQTVELAEVAREWGAPEDCSLRELIGHAVSPWAELLAAHLQAISDLAAEIRQLRDTNEQILRFAARSTQETLAQWNPESGTYDARGVTAVDAAHARLVERSL